MSTPEHHHKNDGGHYPDCACCKMEAAAPDLLEACKKAAQYGPNMRPADIAQIIAAIAKAKL